MVAIIIIIIIVIIKALSRLCWGWLHELYISIPIYPEPNPQTSCTSSIYFNYIHIPFGLPLPLGGPSTCVAKLLLTGMMQDKSMVLMGRPAVGPSPPILILFRVILTFHVFYLSKLRCFNLSRRIARWLTLALGF